MSLQLVEFFIVKLGDIVATKQVLFLVIFQYPATCCLTTFQYAPGRVVGSASHMVTVSIPSVRRPGASVRQDPALMLLFIKCTQVFRDSENHFHVARIDFTCLRAIQTRRL